jgi:hypothetical protein
VKLPAPHASILDATSGWYRGRARSASARGDDPDVSTCQSFELSPSCCVLPSPWAASSASWCASSVAAPGYTPTSYTPTEDPDVPDDLGKLNVFYATIYPLDNTVTALPDFSTLTPETYFTTTSINVPQRAYSSGFPGYTQYQEYFAVRYVGRIDFSAAGQYCFSLNSDDGSRLYIDGVQEIDNDGIHAMKEIQTSTPITLTAGVHELVVEYFQGPRQYLGIQLYVIPPNGTKVILQGPVTASPPPGS